MRGLHPTPSGQPRPAIGTRLSIALACGAIALLLTYAGCLDPCTMCTSSTSSSTVFTPGGPLKISRGLHTATLLDGGQVLIVGGIGSTVLSSAELYTPESASFSFTSQMNEPRVGQTATLIAGGNVLIAGGRDVTVSQTAEIYQFAAASFAYTAGMMTAPRTGHTATLLPDGTVLITGGSPALFKRTLLNQGALNTAEIYGPSTGTFVALGQSMAFARTEQAATLLPDGKVLITGGADAKGRTLASAEIYDPAGHSFTKTGPMRYPRRDHAAGLLNNGQVLVTGGWGADKNPVNSAELFDESSGTFSDAPDMNAARAYQSLSLFGDGSVLIAGGDALQDAEIYYPDHDLFSTVMRSDSTAGAAGAAATLLNGDVLVTGGGPPVSKNFGYTKSLDQAYLFLSDGSAPLKVGSMTVGLMSGLRSGHTATTLTDGTVLVAGGENAGSRPGFDELYDPVRNVSSPIMQLSYGLYSLTATLFKSGPKAGQVLIAGGSINPPLATDKNVCDAQPAFAPIAGFYDPVEMTESLAENLPLSARARHTATLLANGTVLVTGGLDQNSHALDTTEIYDPATDRWSPGAKMHFARQAQAAALLDTGEVLIAGGCGGNRLPLASAELYNPQTNKFTLVGSMRSARAALTLTLLANGQVLVAGGATNTSAELYNPASRRFVATGAMVEVLSGPTATLLNAGANSGQVLITSGGSINAELYNPSAGSFSLIGPMNIARSGDTATLLPNGNVMVTGGLVGSVTATTPSTEIYPAGTATGVATPAATATPAMP